MKIKKLIKKARLFLDSEERNRKEKKKYLKHVLRKLSKHEKKLLDRLEGASSDEERASVEKRLALVHAQRKKGLGLVKELLESTDGSDGKDSA